MWYFNRTCYGVCKPWLRTQVVDSPSDTRVNRAKVVSFVLYMETAV